MEAPKVSSNPNNPNDTETCTKPMVIKVWGSQGCDTRRNRRGELTWCRLRAERPSSIEFVVI